MKTKLIIDGQEVELENLSRRGGEVSFTLNGKDYQFKSSTLPGGGFVFERQTADGVWQRGTGAAWHGAKGARHVRLGCMEAVVAEPGAAGSAASGEAALSPPAPMPGVVREVFVKKGDEVKKGDKLVMMEAMKLQTVLSAGGDGVVEAVQVKAGDMVTEGQELVAVKER